MDSNNKSGCNCIKSASRVCIPLGIRLWTVFKKIIVLLFYIIFGLSLLFGLIKGISTIPLLPETFFHEKVFLSVLLIYILIYFILYIWMTVTAVELEKKQNAKPRQRYLGIRLKVLKYVDRTMESDESWMQEILTLIKRSIVNNLKGYNEEEEQNIEEAKGRMEKLCEDLFNKENNPTENEMIKKAVCFTIKNKTISHPADLQGKRRCYILIGLLHEILKTSKSHSLSWKKYFPCQKTIISFISSCLQGFKSCSKGSDGKKYSNKSILITSIIILLFTVVPFIVDNVTDISVLFVYWNLYCSLGKEKLYSRIFSTASYGPLTFPGTEIFMPLLYLSIFYGISLVLTIFTNPFKRISTQFKTQVKMKTPNVEHNGEIICPSSIVQRYDLPIDESSLESPSQCMIQFGIYLSLVPLVYVLEKIGHGQVDDTITSAYNKKLEFIETFILSGIISVFAITMGQVKKNLIFQEFNISCKQNVIYFLASLMSTIYYICGITLCLVTSLGTNYNEAGFSTIVNINSISSNYPIIDDILVIVFITMAIFVNPIITYITRSKEEKLKLPASKFSWLSQIFSVGNLPTSQHIVRSYYNIYHNSTMKSPQLIYHLAEKIGASFVIICFTVCFSSHENFLWSIQPLNCTNCTNTENNTVVDLQRFQETNVLYLLPKSALSLEIKNYMTISLVILPVCLFLSYLFLWAYFSMDNGFFGAVAVDYYFDNDTNINESQDDKDKMGHRKDYQLLPNTASNLVAHAYYENTTEEMDQEDIETNPSNDWIETWIDKDGAEEWYRYLWRKLTSWMFNKKIEASKRFDMTGTWMDLTGDEGPEGNCEDGQAVLNGEQGSLEYSIKMSFPFYWKQNNETVSFGSAYYSNCCCSWCPKNKVNEDDIEMEDRSEIVSMYEH